MSVDPMTALKCSRHPCRRRGTDKTVDRQTETQRVIPAEGGEHLSCQFGQSTTPAQPSRRQQSLNRHQALTGSASPNPEAECCGRDQPVSCVPVICRDRLHASAAVDGPVLDTGEHLTRAEESCRSAQKCRTTNGEAATTVSAATQRRCPRPVRGVNGTRNHDRILRRSRRSPDHLGSQRGPAALGPPLSVRCSKIGW